MPGIIESVRKQLIENADENSKAGGERFFKEEVHLYGVKTATVTQIGNQASSPSNEKYWDLEW